MWLMEQRSNLTKNNMLKRNGQVDPCCYFCDEPEDTYHLFFKCHVARVVWGIIALCFHQMVRPSPYDQYWAWIPTALPGREKIYMVGLTVVCWAI
jgi:hypothetical protein